MENKIQQALAPVRRRQRFQATYQTAIMGLIASAIAGVIVAVWKFWAVEPITTQTAVAILVAGPIAGAVLGMIWRRTWLGAATAVDEHYELKDRTVTALDFVKHPNDSEFHSLQISDATEHLATVNAAQVVPIRMPRPVPYAVLSLVVAAAMLLWPVQSQNAQADFDESAGIQQAASEIAEDIKDLEEFAEEEQNEELMKLVEELNKDLEELKEPETDVRDALATISEMQAKMAEQQAQFNETVVDAQMQSLAEAMATAEAFNAAASELKEGKYDEAAEALEKMEEAKLDRKEARSAGEKLKKVSEEMAKAELGKLSETVGDLSEGSKSSNSSKICESCKSLSKSLKKHASRKALSKMLASKCKKLGECKSMCKKSGMCKSCGSGKCKGAGQCKKNSLAKGKTNSNSQKASNNWGKKSHGGLDGDPTKLASTRQLEEITAEAGLSDGPSEFETTTAPEGKETARRKYKKAFDKYQKMSEAVLESEEIPLGHRQTIRRYFELIRPSKEEAIEKEKEAAK